MSNPRKRFKDFIRQDNWYVAAGLVVVLYIVTSVTLRFYFIETSDMQKILHVLPLIAALMVVIGRFEKKRRDEALRIRRKKRYEARLEISRLKRELGPGAKGAAPEEGADRGPGEP